MRTLLIDDNPSVCFLHSMLLKKYIDDIDLHIMEDAQEAIYFLEKNQKAGEPFFGLILLDLNMPGMDGWEFLSSYEAHISSDFRDKPKIFMVTNSDNPEDIARAEASSILSGFVSKPLTEIDLTKIILPKLQVA